MWHPNRNLSLSANCIESLGTYHRDGFLATCLFFIPFLQGMDIVKEVFDIGFLVFPPFAFAHGLLNMVGGVLK